MWNREDLCFAPTSTHRVVLANVKGLITKCQLQVALLIKIILWFTSNILSSTTENRYANETSGINQIFFIISVQIKECNWYSNIINNSKYELRQHFFTNQNFQNLPMNGFKGIWGILLTKVNRSLKMCKKLDNSTDMVICNGFETLVKQNVTFWFKKFIIIVSNNRAQACSQLSNFFLQEKESRPFLSNCVHDFEIAH